ncbi:dynamin family protein [Bacillus methanolicus]|uniref:Putative GTPase n=1 Tax=Bacillus methanolicus (strain MGA3 / ATCC 53907) TaxID=796606 RepID=I3E9R0_BACMM|nr:dynamin family protein [Bacillus methanolicus]AIE60479.1 putative GTPase [Bacillus methanolicus MGA3]EIJ83231.1 putative GTPase [Bacillus methanolicus MGA3]
MVKTITQQDQPLIEKIIALYTFFKKNNDQENEQKVKQLARKWQEKEFSIGFCGHFSAGKSSMINALIGENLLPSSPIPTSANLVKIKSGKDYAKVYFKQGKPRLYPAPYDFETVKSYAKNGDEIQSIEISHSKTFIPEDTVIMDTPGIDSTDDAHRIATESALHLADIIFYVMDYNHVQSELNFLFTKALSDAGKEIYLVINQIDKHREEELSFTTFKESVQKAFASWGVEPAGIFYTSLKNREHKSNQFPILQNLIKEKISERHELLPITIFHSLQKLADDHYAYLVARDEEKFEANKEIMDGLTEDEQNNVSDKLEEFKKQLDEIDLAAVKVKERLLTETNEILKNAYLMPYQTRELAEKYLESRQPDFKVGLFFTKQKTEEARNERLEQFYNDLSEKVKTQLDWHLRELILNALKSEGVFYPELAKRAQKFAVPFSKDLLMSAVKPGARLSGEYVLNYTSEVAESLKKEAKQEIFPLIEALSSFLQEKNAEAKSKLEAEFKQLKKIADAKRNLDAIQEKQMSARFAMEEILMGSNHISMDHDAIFSLFSSEEEEAEIITDMKADSYVLNKKSWASGRDADDSINQGGEDTLSDAMLEKLIRKLRFTGEKIRSIPGMRKLSDELLRKADRLENQQFTVALFGAFSAGKSSFANALMGTDLLPVSPNPTTAAINKIKPVDNNHSHGVVIVKLKESAALFEEVQRSLHFFGFNVANFDEGMAAIQNIEGKEVVSDAAGKMHFAFLSAFYKGFKLFQNRLGEKVQTDLKEFREFVANEEKSCFVEEIEVFIDCPLTRAGITLVDTPGADSINARHTGVAFNYIKNSDAILFVTYYNHAFSKADREFLIQLGRVKETFELDKMFFIVNAIDLASNEEEMASVMEYVQDQLLQYGIRQPNLFPVSSLLALKEKNDQLETEESRINDFEKAFYSFISGDLMKIAESSAKADLVRASGLLAGLIASSMEDESVKKQKYEKVKAEKERLLAFLQSQAPDLLKNQLNQEADELVFYIKQRVFFRFGDFFKEAFNPAVLKDDGRNLKKALQTALEDLLESIGFDFAQEMRATSLRVEAFITKILKNFYTTLTQEMAAKSEEGIAFSQFESPEYTGIEFQNAFKELDRAMFKKTLGQVKNLKSFFEKNEKRFLAEELEGILQESAEQYLLTENSRMKEHYIKLLSLHFDNLLHNLAEQTEEYYSGLMTALGEGFPIDELKEIEKQIHSFS